MNDLEHDLRTLLEDKAAGAGASEPDRALLRRARRRQLGIVLGGAILAAAVVAGVVVGISAFGPTDRRAPAEPGQLVDTTVNGITITHPETWYVVDPVEAGIEPASNDLPHLILWVSDSDPIASGTLGCPGLAGGATDGFVFTIQQEPLALVGDRARGWPVELEPLDVGDAESACYPGWSFSRAGWTTRERTYEARLGVAPGVSEADRQALDSAFGSLRFAPTKNAPDQVVIATGTAGGEGWELIASGGRDGLQLGLEWATGGAGTGGYGDTPVELHLSSRTFGQGDRAQLVVFGAVPADAVRLTIVEGGSTRDIEIVDVPDAIDARWEALVFTADPGQRIVVSTYDADGRLLDSAEVGPEPGEPAGTPLPAEPNEVLFRGRTNDCFWTLSLSSAGTDRERLELSPREAGTPVDLVVDTSLDAAPLQIGWFDCPSDGSNAVLVFGIATDEVADVQWTDALGADGGPPECIDSTLPSRLCVVLADFSGPGEAIALDADGREIGRVPYG